MTTLSIQSILDMGKAITFEASCNMSLGAQDPSSQSSLRHQYGATNPDDQGCKLLDSFAILVQLALASTALITLFYKRSRERPQRPVIVWTLDVSKQFAGAAVIHFLNLLVSYIAGRPSKDRPKTNLCVWYFLNVAVDTTIGVVILWMWLRIIQSTLIKLNVKQIKTGHYGSPPLKRMLIPWLKQTTIFIAAESLMKLCVYGMFRYWTFLFSFGEWVLRWTEGNYRYQVIFVMLIFPLVMNIIQFWIVDTIVKVGPVATAAAAAANKTQQHDELESNHDTTNHHRQNMIDHDPIDDERAPLLPK